jgi:cytochrome P450 family 135
MTNDPDSTQTEQATAVVSQARTAEQARSSLPPGPRYPKLLTVYLTAYRTKAFLDTAYKRYGDVFTVRLIYGKTLVFVADPALIEDVFTAGQDVLTADKGATPILGANSIVGLDADEHRAARELLAPAFHGDQIQRYHERMERVCAEESASWPVGEEFELLPRFEAITRSVVTSALFGVDGNASLDLLATRFDELMAFRSKPSGALALLLMPPGATPPKAFQRKKGAYDDAVFKAIDEVRQDPHLDDRDDIVAMLLQARHDDGSPLSDDEIRDHVTTLLIMGHVSTATTMAWMFERLVRHPEALERLRAEALTDSEEYLDAVLTETLRVRPAVALIVREVSKPFQVREYEIPPGTLMAANAYGLQLREDLYPEPLQFRPERFLGEKPAPYTWISFGGGEHHCIGRSFALMEMKLVIRMLMRQFRFRTTEQSGEKAKRKAINFMPGDGARVVIDERVSPTT